MSYQGRSNIQALKGDIETHQDRDLRANHGGGTVSDHESTLLYRDKQDFSLKTIDFVLLIIMLSWGKECSRQLFSTQRDLVRGNQNQPQGRSRGEKASQQAHSLRTRITAAPHSSKSGTQKKPSDQSSGRSSTQKHPSQTPIQFTPSSSLTPSPLSAAPSSSPPSPADAHSPPSPPPDPPYAQSPHYDAPLPRSLRIP